MRFTRFSSRLLAASVAVMLLAGYLFVSIAPAGSPEGRSTARAASAPASTLLIEKNGSVVATYHVVCGPQQICNQIEFDWKVGKCPPGSKLQSPPVSAVFTSGTGAYSGLPPALAPCSANDLEFTPVQTAGTTTSTISNAWWTKNGAAEARILPPQVSLKPPLAQTSYPPLTGIHAFWSYAKGERLTRVRLRHDAKIVAALKVPAGANQAEWLGYLPPQGTK